MTKESPVQFSAGKYAWWGCSDRDARIIVCLVQLTVGQAEGAQAGCPVLLHVLPGHPLHAAVHWVVACQPLIDDRVCTLHPSRKLLHHMVGMLALCGMIILGTMVVMTYHAGMSRGL